MMYRIAVLLLCAVAAARADEATFVAAVDKNPVSAGEQFTLSLTLTNAGVGGGKNLQLPDLSKFHIMAGPNQSSSMQFINGVVSSSVTFTYVLQPKEIGRITVGPAAIEAGGTTYRTAPIVLEVVKGSVRPQQQQQAGRQDVAAQIGDNLFLRADVDRAQVRQGEQINLTFKLYTRVSVANYAINKNPTMTGFWGEEVENPRNIALSNETVNGKQYRVGVIRRMALFPTQAGTLEISPMEVQTTVQIQSRRMADPFDAFFRDPFGESVNYMVKSDPLKIRVEALPPGAPSSFKGAVGKFTMNAGVDRREATTNEPISLKVTISGTGNVKLLEAPPVDLPVDFEQYTPKVTDNISKEGGKISGSKTFEYLLIPRYPGTRTIRPVSFSFFDPSKKEYRTLTSSAIEIRVAQGTAAVGPLVAGGGRENVQVLSQDIRFIKVTTSGLPREGSLLYRSGLFLALLLLPLAGFAAALLVARQRTAVMNDEAGYRTRRALKVARKGLRRAERLLKATGDARRPVEFHAEVAKAMWKYLGDKLQLPPADMSMDRAAAGLTSRGVPVEVVNGLKNLLESCEMARFAPGGINESVLQSTYDAAGRVIVDIERTLKTS